ncbi:MAG TPA: twin-arginine translocation signal domain-containing protein [Verrucomicrobiae bacterium]|nr:twin-arginine translocation signal domain-containing protein [Verrucomicrobiae bacterium]
MAPMPEIDSGHKASQVGQVARGAIAFAKNFLVSAGENALNPDYTMRPDETNPARRRQTRRQFIKQTGLTAAAVAGANLLQPYLFANEGSPGISIVLDPDDAVLKQSPVTWAAAQLRETLAARGIATQICPSLDQVPLSQECILVAGRNSNLSQRLLADAKISLPDTPEAMALTCGKVEPRTVLLASGSDARGLVYALLELADRVKYASDPVAMLRDVKPVSEQPANPVRSVGRAFASNVEDIPWFNDRDFWTAYLTMLATHRFNRFNLAFGLGYDFTTDIRDCYFHFAYPFLLTVPGYNVRAVPLPDAERDHNLEMLRFISDETAKRGLQFQLGLWTHAYRWTDSPKANYTIEGLTPETQATYCRDALRTLLAACPSISGITLRTHGESGVPEGNTAIWKTILDGVVQCGRNVRLDLHAKGIDQEIINVALGTGMPVEVSPKFWAEHMGLPYMQGAIRPQEMPPTDTRDNGFFARSAGSRRFTRYGYADLLMEKRRYGVVHRIWPGTQRQLLWGDPEMARAYGQVSSFCGSNGVELLEPLYFKGRKGSGLPGGRDAYADASLKPVGGDYDKYDYSYRVWGRNFYNPDTDPDGWQRLLRRQFGQGAEPAGNALASASRILPLVTTAHCPSAANNVYWPEMYTNMPMVDPNRPHPYSDTPEPRRFGTVSPLDPEFFLTVDEFATELLKGEKSGKYSPAWVSQQLDEAAQQAIGQWRAAKSNVRDASNPQFRRLEIDVAIQAGLGRFFASKFRAGMLYAIYEQTGHRPALAASLKTQYAAREAWAQLAETAKDPYVHDITYGYDYFMHGHWLDRLSAMDDDLADMEKLLKNEPDTLIHGRPPTKADPKIIKQAIRAVFAKSKPDDHPPLANLHEPAASFQRGQPLTILARVPNASHQPLIAGLRLRYRHVNQGEVWQMAEMNRAGEGYQAVIAASYTDLEFPLQYHFQIRNVSDQTWLHPGLEHRWHGQPYFFVCQRA